MFTKVLVQTMMGAPHSVYHGGLLRATVRYFDKDRVRPGLPQEVGALVDMLAPDGGGHPTGQFEPERDAQADCAGVGVW